MTTVIASTGPAGLTAWRLDDDGLTAAPLAGWDRDGEPVVVGLDGKLSQAAEHVLVLPTGERPRGWAHVALLANRTAATASTVSLLGRCGVVTGAVDSWAAWVRQEAQREAGSAHDAARDVVADTDRGGFDLATELVGSAIPDWVTTELAQGFILDSIASAETTASVW